MVAEVELETAKESPALLADEARRARTARAIAAVFAVMTVLGAVPPVLIRAAWDLAAIQLLTAALLGAIWWRARTPHRASQTGLAVAAVFLLQVITLSRLLPLPQAHQLAYLIAVAPLVGAATLRARGVALTGVMGLLSHLALALFRPASEGAQAWQGFIPAMFFFVAIWTIAVFAALASERAVREHARDERRAERAQALAKEAEDRYRLVAELTSDVVSVLDERGRYVYVSPSFERVLGLCASELLATDSPPVLSHPDDRKVASDAFSRTLIDGRATVVTRCRVADGGYRWFHVSMSRLDDKDGPGRVAVSGRDITEQHELSDALEATRRMEALGRLAGGVAHDFNNLLMVIKTCSDFASSQLPPDHQAQVDLKDVRGAVERAVALTQQLLTFARRQVSPPDRASVVSKVVTDVAPILARLCGPETRFTLETQGSTLEVEASAVQLEQLFMNLAANARDAMPKGGELQVRISDRTLAAKEVGELPSGRYVEITVEDTGVGMSPEVQARMFEPFFTTKPAGSGTGLGLATVFGLVTQLRGHIQVRSAPGAGTAFSILLPEAQAWPARETSRVSERERPTEALDVLVVEDEATVRALIVRILNNAGHRVTQADTIEAAFEAAETPGLEFDAIVTDVVIGSGDGLTMLERVTRAQPGAAVVVVSGFTPDRERVASLAASGAEFLPKPFGASALLASLMRARSRRRV